MSDIVERLLADKSEPTIYENVVRKIPATALEIEAAHEITRLRAALESERDAGWQPIDTAPKTSRARLIWVPDNLCIYCVVWRDGDGDRPAGWEVFGGTWRSHIQGGTHWRPLPPDPEGKP